MVDISQQGTDTLISVKIVPNASRDRIAGELGEALKITVSAAPERGAANKAVCRLLARNLDIRPQQITVDTGATSAQKTIRIADMPAGEVAARLGLNAS
jgi:hypothetical protein